MIQNSIRDSIKSARAAGSLALAISLLLIHPPLVFSQGTRENDHRVCRHRCAAVACLVCEGSRHVQKNGLEVQLVNFTGGPTAAAALISGDVAVTQVSGPSIVSANLKGADTIFIAGGTVTLDYWLMSRKEIKTAEELKGGNIGIGRFGA